MGIFVEIIGYGAGLCTAIFVLPQTIKTIKTKDINGLSLASYLIYCISMVMWATYGVLLNSYPMIIFNLISLSFALPILYLLIKNSKLK
ncbi:MAG: SemiSWEET family transporter [Alphaproteobacteria bacterium]